MKIEYVLFDHEKLDGENFTLTPTTTVYEFPEIGHFTQSGLRKISKYLQQIKGMEKVTIATTPSKLLQIGNTQSVMTLNTESLYLRRVLKNVLLLLARILRPLKS